MFVAFHVLVGGSIHATWTCLFVLSTEVMPEPWRVANGAIFNFGNLHHHKSKFPSNIGNDF